MQFARLLFGLLVVVCAGRLALSAPAAELPPAAKQKIDFVRDIQPILAKSCYECHGAQKQKAELRWDVKAIALKGGEHGPVIVPGRSAESLMIQLVAGLKGDDRVMPKKGDRLTAEQIGLLRAWIDQGANWPDTASAKMADPRDHWAFKPPVCPKIPTVKDKSWTRGAIDNFALAKLERENLKPSPEADKITLLRRLALDLTGLPPSIAEVDAFLADQSKDAYEKQVDRLLASPHYGERWGRHWLDAARFSDSDGYEKDMSRQVHFYRDYVINAFNRDLPYDRFLIEQLAGDQLPDATQDQIVATGFLRNSMLNQEGAIDPEQFRIDAMFDRMDAIGKAMLGLTIQCAQCHNHKYDPISQEEYYRMFAFINNDHEARPAVYLPAEQAKVTAIRRGIADAEMEVKRRTPGWEKRMAAWEKEVSANQPEWFVLPLDHLGENEQRYILQKDGSLLAAGYAPTKFTTRWQTTNYLTGITAFRLELMTDPNLPYGGPGRSFMGTCALTDFSVDAKSLAQPTNKTKVKIIAATADVDQVERALESNFHDKSKTSRNTGPVQFAIDGKGETAWGIDAGPGRRNQERKAVFQAERPVGYAGGTILTISLQQNHGGWNSDDHMNNNLGRFRLSVTTNAGPVVADPLPKKVRDILTNVPRNRRTLEQTAAVFSYWRTTVPEWKEANAKIDALMNDWPAAASALTLVSREEPRDTRILKRGDWLRPAAAVTPGVPAILNPLPKNAPGTRLTIARWLADKKSPTTARVFVNRAWQAYFGLGLVSTSEDLGTQTEAPSHPELLDWLAVEFIDHGWSVKTLHRRIVNSATYRQSSRITPELYERDPNNRLLARGPRFRVEGEIVRDIALTASGLLNEKIGGRSVMPPAPAFLFQPPASYAPFPWKDEAGLEKYRRALYTFRRRSTPYPALQTFDVPNADQACVRRLRSNSPLQALVSLNEPIFVECAQSLARKTLEEGGATDADRVTYAFRRALSRPPTVDEKQELLALLDKQTKRLEGGTLNANEIATGVKDAPQTLPAGATATQWAAYTVVSRVLLNLDETITKE